ncbi:rab15 effector protein-like [Erpetoichthys calabaricus]|uniref:RAB15 effector protein n=1 Tax=Erpetoichthys calabaricus TaxID=27687 RepID=A0A8C4RZJ2_ERPCA|nr:rab15 effector protein-like [Erpetoichthys calabaricus]
MGQVQDREPVQQERKTDALCDVFGQGIAYAAQKLKEYLGFEDPQSKLQPSTDTLNEIFLVNFITFCVEKGVEEHITTSKMTKQQSLLFGVDWIWTLFGPDKSVRLQFTVQTTQLSDSALKENAQPPALPPATNNRTQTSVEDALFRDKGKVEKLEEFCSLIGEDCVGLFIAYGLPGKPREMRGALLESIRKYRRKKASTDESAVRDYFMNTDTFLSTLEMLERCLNQKSGRRDIGNVYISFI